jgi:hypothetical protein
MQFVNGNYISIQPAVPNGQGTLALALSSYTASDLTVGGKVLRQWYPATSWIYDSDETVDGSGAAGEPTVRVHEDAGTSTVPAIPAPSSAYWHQPLSVPATPTSSLQRSGWYRSPVVTRVNRHGAPEDIVDVKGLHIVVQYDPTEMYPEAVIHNAYAGSSSGAAWYDSFESGVTTNEHFTGRRALEVSGTVSIARPARVAADGVISDELLVRAWVKEGSNSTASIVGNLSIGGNTIDVDDVRATVHGWQLIEVECPAAVADAVSVDVMNGLIVWIDDVIVHPIAAISQATVLDQEYRPIASLSSDHFPIRTAYSADGRQALSTADAEHGRIGSVAEYAHVPGKTRNSSDIQGGAQSIVTGSMVLPAVDSVAKSIEQQSRILDELLRKIGPQGINANASLLDVTITPDSVNTSTVLQPLFELLKSGSSKKSPADTIQTPRTKVKQ